MVLIAASSLFHAALDQAVSLVCVVFKICLFSLTERDAYAELRIWEAPRAPHGGDDPAVALQTGTLARDARRQARCNQHRVKTDGRSEPAIE
jgi:hypothetical protein